MKSIADHLRPAAVLALLFALVVAAAGLTFYPASAVPPVVLMMFCGCIVLTALVGWLLVYPLREEHPVPMAGIILLAVLMPPSAWIVVWVSHSDAQRAAVLVRPMLPLCLALSSAATLLIGRLLLGAFPYGERRRARRALGILLASLALTGIVSPWFATRSRYLDLPPYLAHDGAHLLTYLAIHAIPTGHDDTSYADTIIQATGPSVALGEHTLRLTGYRSWEVVDVEQVGDATDELRAVWERKVWDGWGQPLDGEGFATQRDPPDGPSNYYEFWLNWPAEAELTLMDAAFRQGHVRRNARMTTFPSGHGGDSLALLEVQTRLLHRTPPALELDLLWGAPRSLALPLEDNAVVGDETLGIVMELRASATRSGTSVVCLLELTRPWAHLLTLRGVCKGKIQAFEQRSMHFVGWKHGPYNASFPVPCATEVLTSLSVVMPANMARARIPLPDFPTRPARNPPLGNLLATQLPLVLMGPETTRVMPNVWMMPGYRPLHGGIYGRHEHEVDHRMRSYWFDVHRDVTPRELLDHWIGPEAWSNTTLGFGFGPRQFQPFSQSDALARPWRAVGDLTRAPPRSLRVRGVAAQPPAMIPPPAIPAATGP